MKKSFDKNKKGQMSQTFTIIFALLIMSIIAYVSAKSIGNIMEDKCNADYITFKQDLTSTIVKNKDYGSVSKERLLSPCDYTELCFVDGSVDKSNFDVDEVSNLEATMLKSMIEKTVNSGTRENVFLYNGDTVKSLDYIKDIELENPNKPFCIRARGGRFNFVTYGQGRTTRILSTDVLEQDEQDEQDE